MTRRPREISEAGFYHVIVRGNGKQLLFDDDADRDAFLTLLTRFLEGTEVKVLAWCLMDNHVHLCLSEDPQTGLDEISKIMRVLQTEYAKRFNGRTGHAGHIFQARFASMPINDGLYLLQAVRYIHNNPQKAGICPMAEYRWSSYSEYLGTPGLCDTAPVLDELGGVEGFIEFSNAEGDDGYRFRFGRHVDDADLSAVASCVLDGMDPRQLKGLPKEERDRRLRDLRSAGMTIDQTMRLTGIGRTTVANSTRQ